MSISHISHCDAIIRTGDKPQDNESCPMKYDCLRYLPPGRVHEDIENIDWIQPPLSALDRDCSLRILAE